MSTTSLAASMVPAFVAPLLARQRSMVMMDEKLAKLVTAVESLQDSAMGVPACPETVAMANASR